MPLSLVIGIIKALIPSRRVSTYLSWPSEIRLILNAFKDFINGLLECHINSLGTLCWALPGGPWLSPISLLKLLGVILFMILWWGRSFTFALQSIIFQPFVLLNPSHQLMHVFRRLHDQKISQLWLLGETQLEGASCYLLISPLLSHCMAPNTYSYKIRGSHHFSSSWITKNLSVAHYKSGSKRLRRLPEVSDKPLP